MPPNEENAAPTLRADMVAIVPCYNAGPLVKPVVTKLIEMLDHVIVVDDGSTDGATQELEELPITLLKHDVNRGKGHALLTGYQEALKIPNAVAICVLDADGQHDPDELPALFDAFLQKDADLVIGSRVFTGGHVPWRSRFGNQLTATITAILLGKRFPDTQSGYRMLSRPYAAAVVENVPGGRYETEMEIFVKAVCGKWRVVPVPIKTIYESGNVSSHFNKYRDSFLVYFRLLQAILRHRFKPRT
jgi:glycosyltransferase involved in cell wall biosynthesis